MEQRSDEAIHRLRPLDCSRCWRSQHVDSSWGPLRAHPNWIPPAFQPCGWRLSVSMSDGKRWRSRPNQTCFLQSEGIEK